MNRIKIEIYKTKNRKQVEIEDFKEAVNITEFLISTLTNNWTRHSSCQSDVYHLNQIHSLWNEGSITLNVYLK